jgi:hypothetical protein
MSFSYSGALRQPAGPRAFCLVVHFLLLPRVKLVLGMFAHDSGAAHIALLLQHVQPCRLALLVHAIRFPALVELRTVGFPRLADVIDIANGTALDPYLSRVRLLPRLFTDAQIREIAPDRDDAEGYPVRPR